MLLLSEVEPEVGRGLDFVGEEYGGVGGCEAADHTLKIEGPEPSQAHANAITDLCDGKEGALFEIAFERANFHGPGVRPVLAVEIITDTVADARGAVLDNLDLIAEASSHLDKGSPILTAYAGDLLVQRHLSLGHFIGRAGAGIGEARNALPIGQQFESGARVFGTQSSSCAAASP